MVGREPWGVSTQEEEERDACMERESSVVYEEALETAVRGCNHMW